ncbi:hypothetical protein HWI79_1402 [Cryptosporidium felis]|nr:hypothetical protein HWI79_1402 [Cryptosporidium felis]
MSGNTLLVPPRSAFKSREELCAFVSYKMRRATELFTFKCSLYQRELKLYLPEPVPKHRRWIDTFDSESIVTIPFSKIEKDEIELFRKNFPQDLDLDSMFPGDLLQRSFKKRISCLLTSLVNKIVFLLVLRHDTWYVHQEARDGLREYLVEKIWPRQPRMRLIYRDHITTFVDTRIRHFRDSVGRYFRDLQANSRNGDVTANMIVTCDYKQSELDEMITKALEEQKEMLETEKNSEYVNSPKQFEKFNICNSGTENGDILFDSVKCPRKIKYFERTELEFSGDEAEVEDRPLTEIKDEAKVTVSNDLFVQENSEAESDPETSENSKTLDPSLKKKCIKISQDTFSYASSPAISIPTIPTVTSNFTTSAYSSTSGIDMASNLREYYEKCSSPKDDSSTCATSFFPERACTTLREDSTASNHTNRNFSQDHNSFKDSYSNIVYRNIPSASSPSNPSSSLSCVSSSSSQTNSELSTTPGGYGSILTSASNPLLYQGYLNGMFNYSNCFGANKDFGSIFGSSFFLNQHLSSALQTACGYQIPQSYFMIPSYNYPLQPLQNSQNPFPPLNPYWVSPPNYNLQFPFNTGCSGATEVGNTNFGGRNNSEN